MRDVNSREKRPTQIARSPRALFNARLDIQNRRAISELRPFKDVAFSGKSMGIDGFESILGGSLLKSVHFLPPARFLIHFQLLNNQEEIRKSLRYFTRSYIDRFASALPKRKFDFHSHILDIHDF